MSIKGIQDGGMIEHQTLQKHTPQSSDHMKKTPENIDKEISRGSREFVFSIHEGTKQVMIKVIDSNSKEVVTEVPPEKILDMVAEMCENMGLFIDKRV